MKYLIIMSLMLSGCSTIGGVLRGAGDGLSNGKTEPVSQVASQDPECNQYKNMMIYGVYKTCFVSCAGPGKDYQCN